MMRLRFKEYRFIEGSSYYCSTALQVPEKTVMLHTLFPEVFAMISLIEIELHNVLVVPLGNK
jgi:hypothetical protein